MNVNVVTQVSRYVVTYLETQTSCSLSSLNNDNAGFPFMASLMYLTLDILSIVLRRYFSLHILALFSHPADTSEIQRDERQKGLLDHLV